MAWIMVQYVRPSCSSWAESVRSSFSRTIVGKAIWENPFEAWLRENSKFGMSLCSSWKRIILICVCGNRLERNKTLIRCENYSKSIWENQHFPLIMCTWDCTDRQCEISKYILDNYRAMFESRISAGRLEKLPLPQNLRISSWSLWYGRSCKEVCGTIWWVGKQDDSATLQSIHSMHRWPPLQRRRNAICWRIVTCMLSNCPEMLILCTNWTTWYSMVSE